MTSPAWLVARRRRGTLAAGISPASPIAGYAGTPCARVARSSAPCRTKERAHLIGVFVRRASKLLAIVGQEHDLGVLVALGPATLELEEELWLHAQCDQ